VGSKVIRNVTKILKATSGRLFGRVTSGTGRGEELTPADVRTLIAFDESVDDRVAALLAEGTNITITYNDELNTLTIASTAGGLSGTGSVDNAALRADGTGGATLQSSAIVIDDLYTASPNNTVNFTCIKPTGGTTNVGVAIVPKGTGAFSLRVPDGTAAGGNARGANAIDLQTLRSSSAQVAAGEGAFLVGAFGRASGNYSTCFSYGIASGNGSFAFGAYANATSTASGVFSFAGGGATASSDVTMAFGYQSVASAAGAISLGVQNTASGSDGSIALGNRSAAHRGTMFAYASGYFGSANGDSQFVLQVMRVKTTNSTPTTMQTGHEDRIGRLTIPSGKIMFCNVLVSGIKSDGSAAACYKRKLAIKNVGGTTSLVGSVETIGTDIEDNALTDVAMTADNTNDALQINVTGITGETWRWVAVVEGLEIAYGT
jgi:hypothetical protein